MSAISAKAINSTIGTENYRGLDEVFSDYLNKMGDFRYVPSDVPLLIYSDSFSVTGTLSKTTLAEFTMPKGGCLWYSATGFSTGAGVSLSADKTYRIVKSADLGGDTGDVIFFDEGTTFTISIRKTTSTATSYTPKLVLKGELKAGKYNYIDVIQYELPEED